MPSFNNPKNPNNPTPANHASRAGMPSNIPNNSGPAARAAAPKPALKPLDVIANEIIDGKWGNGAERKQRLEAAGYTYDIVQKAVNRMLAPKELDDIAKLVIRGDFGNGAERRKRLEDKGYDYNAVQAKVNQLLGQSSPQNLDDIARRVIRG